MIGERAAAVGYLSGLVTGVGLSGFGWMNPYIALTVLLAGIIYLLTVRRWLRDLGEQEGE